MSARGETVGIVGAGAFGAALASAIGRTGRKVLVWSRDAAVVEAMQTGRRSPRLPEASFAPSVDATTDPRRLAAEARLLILAVVSTDVRARARELGAFLDGSHLVIHAVGALAAPRARGQGETAEVVDERVSEVVAEGLPTQMIGVMAGPALPLDLASGQYASVVVASAFAQVVSEARRLCNAPPALRVYGSTDVVGVELASALAGAYTLGLGLADGLGLGAVPRAVLITRAIAEASRFGISAGAEAKTFAGLAGLGNLLVRGSVGASERSVDYALGHRLARGETVPGLANASEGARAALSLSRVAARQRVRMPLLSALAAVVSGQATAQEVARGMGEQVGEIE